MFSGRLLLSASLLVSTAMLAACGGNAGTSVPFSPSAPQSLALPDTKPTPPPCKGQKNKTNFASVTDTLSTKGGTFCVPSFGDFGGSVEYPDASPSIKLALKSSDTNYANLPELGNGTAIFYLQLAFNGDTTFAKKLKAGGGLTGSGIVPGKIYTAYAQAQLGSYIFHFTPCFQKAAKGKYGGVITDLGVPFEAQSITNGTTAIFEVYKGQQTTYAC